MRGARGALVKAGLLTGLVSLLSFGLAHAAFITPLVPRDPEVPLALLLATMVAAPMLFGALPTVVASLLGAGAWSATRARGRLPGWRFGAALAAGLVPIVAASAALGPLGDEEPGFATIVPLVAPLLVVPAAIGAWAGGVRAAVLMALAVVPTGFLNTMFILGGGIGLWTGLFAASIVGIWIASGWWMDHLARRFLPTEAAEVPPRSGGKAHAPGAR